MNTKPCKNSGLAFLLSFVMFIFLLIAGFTIGLRGGLLKGNSISEILKNNNIDKSVSTFLKDTLDTQLKSSGVEGIPDDVISDEIISEITNAVTDVMFEENGSVSFEDAKKTVFDTIDSEKDKMLDSYIAEADSSDSFDPRNSSIINKYTEEYNITLGEEFYNKLEEYTPGSDADSFKESVNTYLDDKVFNDLEAELDNALAEAEIEINNSITELQGSEAFKTFDKIPVIHSKVTLWMTVTLILAAAMFLIQFLLYKNGLYGPFKNAAIVFGISSIPFLLAGLLPSLVKPFIADILADSSANGVNMDGIVNNLISSIFKPFGTIGITYLIIMAVMIVIAVVLTNLRKKKMAVTDQSNQVY